ncbi:DMT family transporter [Nocardia sp. NPDC127579]|uniref:DMT family transporter n=1 Tax=Nocardia sp. NPDC127579 TaxID=3345402 RepID=UPI003641C0CF
MKAYFTIAVQPLFVLMWSSAFIAGIIGVGAAPPMLVLLGRYVIGGALLAGYAWAVRATWPRGQTLRHVVIAGLLMQIVQFGAFYTAMSHQVSGAVIALIQGLNPVLIAVFAGFLGETVTARQWAGFGIGGVGVAAAVVDQSNFSVAGLLLCLLGLFGLSMGTVYQKRFAPQVDSRASTAVHALASAPIAAVLVLATQQWQIRDLPHFAAALTWIVLVNSVAAFLLLNAMLRRWDATRVGRLFFATPAVTALLAWLLVDQPLRPLTIAGLGVGVLGLVLASARPQSAGRPAPQPVAAR